MEARPNHEATDPTPEKIQGGSRPCQQNRENTNKQDNNLRQELSLSFKVTEDDLTLIAKAEEKGAENFSVVFQPTSQGDKFQRMNPLPLRQTLAKHLPKKSDVLNLQYLPSGSLQIEVAGAEAARRLLTITTIGNRKVKAFIRHDNITKVGVLKRVDPTLDAKEILQELQEDDQEVTEVRRILKPDGKAPLGTVFVRFLGVTLPEYVNIGYERHKVIQYQYRPRQCHKCQHFGHLAKHCKGKTACQNCGDAHEQNEACNLPQKCANCKGPHTARDRTCPHFKRETSFLYWRHEKNLPYQEARQRSQEDHPTYATVTKQNIKQNEQPQEDGNTLHKDHTYSKGTTQDPQLTEICATQNQLVEAILNLTKEAQRIHSAIASLTNLLTTKRPDNTHQQDQEEPVPRKTAENQTNQDNNGKTPSTALKNTTQESRRREQTQEKQSREVTEKVEKGNTENTTEQTQERENRTENQTESSNRKKEQKPTTSNNRTNLKSQAARLRSGKDFA